LFFSNKSRKGATQMATVVQTNVFGMTTDGGNPCPLVLGGESLTSEQMQQIAARFGVETAFILSPDRPASLFKLRYFVPNHEMSMCVHATVGAVSYWCMSQQRNQIQGTIETSLGEVKVRAQEKYGRLQVTVNQFPPVFSEKNPGIAEVAQALKISEEAFDLSVGPIQSVSTARPKLMIPLRNGNTLQRLEPDFALLWELCDRFGTTGFYPFTLRPQSTLCDVEARQFPNQVGYNEDPATGVAACALGAYLAFYSPSRHQQNGRYAYTVGQGFAMGRPSLLETAGIVSRNRITQTYVGGTATISQMKEVALQSLL
jgi:PhzF family phenazine biosynthesis protein